MKQSITISDFSFFKVSAGTYRVTYRSPKTQRAWSAFTIDMPLIDKTLNSESPKIKDLVWLKKVCKKMV